MSESSSARERTSNASHSSWHWLRRWSWRDEAIVVVMAVALPGVKLAATLGDWWNIAVKIAVAASAVAVAVAVLVRSETRREDGAAALGFLPLYPVRRNGWQVVRAASGLVALALLVAAVLLQGSGRSAAGWALVAIGGAAWVALCVVAYTREAWWRPDAVRRRVAAAKGNAERLAKVGSSATAGLDHTVLWTVTPLVLASIGTMTALEIGNDRSALGGAALAELILLTALGEELIFRGALLTIAHRSLPTWWAHWVTALSFGLWHVGDSLTGSEGSSLSVRLWALAGTVVLTTAGGLVFTWLRYRTRTLLGPVLGHIATNLPGLALGL
ncbi:MAG: lysostaphin resistance A-like protein [Acidimicrobiia bacterium]